MTESFDTSTRSERCCHDGKVTTHPIKVDEVYAASGVGTKVYACPGHAPLYATHRTTAAPDDEDAG
ncbi:hypothetical protein [Streptomyces sp. NPDC014734]|uniref:hypothetical protein n=1 Tax=Streptomyces sp. NPDC014734 TaxID=3364886 RepID=UPI0036FC37EE